jgi:hypothetical protein
VAWLEAGACCGATPSGAASGRAFIKGCAVDEPLEA